MSLTTDTKRHTARSDTHAATGLGSFTSWNAIHHATDSQYSCNDLAWCEMLLRHTANRNESVNARSRFGETPLLSICRGPFDILVAPHRATIKWLIDNGASFDSVYRGPGRPPPV